MWGPLAALSWYTRQMGTGNDPYLRHNPSQALYTQPSGLGPKVGRYVSSGAQDPSFDNAGRRSYQEDALSLPLPYVGCLLSRSRMCLGRHCRGHPVHVSQAGGCPHMCPGVRPNAPSFMRQLSGLPSRVEYLSSEGILLPLVYGTTSSPLWLEWRGHSAWHPTPSWTVYRLACHRLLPWLRVMFAMVPDAAWPGSDQWP